MLWPWLYCVAIKGGCMQNFTVIANFKQGGNIAYIDALIDELKGEGFSSSLAKVDVVLMPPVPYLSHLVASVSGTSMAAGVQVISGRGDGAWTGCYSAAMVAELGARYVCIGHSERRLRFHEDDSLVAGQYVQVVEAGLVPVLCIGESAQQRDKGVTLEVLRQQLSAVFSSAGFQKLPKHDTIVAYEPVWAIGAGKAASVEDVKPIINEIRSFVSQCHGIASSKVCYGGSVDMASCVQFHPVVDGLLVGRASLDVEQLRGVIKQCSG